jgi:hypothetical protein
MRRQRARGRHSRLKDHLIAVPAAEKDEDGFHERGTSAVRADRICCEGNAAMGQILTVAELPRKLTARSGLARAIRTDLYRREVSARAARRGKPRTLSAGSQLYAARARPQITRLAGGHCPLSRPHAVELEP